MLSHHQNTYGSVSMKNEMAEKKKMPHRSKQLNRFVYFNIDAKLDQIFKRKVQTWCETAEQLHDVRGNSVYQSAHSAVVHFGKCTGKPHSRPHSWAPSRTNDGKQQ